MRKKPTIAYEVIRIYYSVNVVNLLLLSATFGGHLQEGMICAAVLDGDTAHSTLTLLTHINLAQISLSVFYILTF